MPEHDCNAWCEPPIHTRIVYTPDDPPFYLQIGKLLSVDNVTIQVVSYDPAPECPPDPHRPEGFDFIWLLRYRYSEYRRVGIDR